LVVLLVMNTWPQIRRLDALQEVPVTAE
jgi:hypothetical protein